MLFMGVCIYVCVQQKLPYIYSLLGRTIQQDLQLTTSMVKILSSLIEARYFYSVDYIQTKLS